MEKKPIKSWEGMCAFLEQNRGLIVNVCRQYKVNPDDVIHHQEDAYIEAVKSYDPSKPLKKYSLANHFGNLLKSKIKGEIAYSKNTVYLDDIINVEDKENHNLTNNLFFVDLSIQNNHSNAEEMEKRRKLLSIIQDSAKKYGNGCYKKVINYILVDDIKSAIEVMAMAECHDAIWAIKEIAKRRKKKKNEGEKD